MKPLFLPEPRSFARLEGSYSLQPGRLVLLQSDQPHLLTFTARRILAALPVAVSRRWELCAGWTAPREQVGLTLAVNPHAVHQPQGYLLRITPSGITITGHDPAGVFYGACTLVQVVKQAGGEPLSSLEVRDWPDFPARGVMLDISRDRVPQMHTLFELVDRLASWKVNQIQLYTEHTFAYRAHPEVWAAASPMTGDQILALDAYCRERFIELVPNQNSFGHMERWLKLPGYASLAEIHGEFKLPSGKTREGPFGLAPLHPGSLELVSSLYDELLPHFTSPLFNIGCDETYDLGQGASQEACRKFGVGRVYLDFLLKIYAEVSHRNRTMLFWGDIITTHPELVSELPGNAIALLWGYEAGHPFRQEAELFARSNLPFYVCPGTSSWNSLAGRTTNAMGNLMNAAENGLKYGACGFLNTDWGDRGHWQVLPVSFLPLAARAAYSWCLGSNRSLDMARITSRFAFDDTSESMGCVFAQLGDAYLPVHWLIRNGTPLFWALQTNLDALAGQAGIEVEFITRAENAIEAAMQPLEGQKMSRPDGRLVLDELTYTNRMMTHACRRMRLAKEKDPGKITSLKQALKNDLKELLELHRSTWLARSRPGGLADSRSRLEALAPDYD